MTPSTIGGSADNANVFAALEDELAQIEGALAGRTETGASD